MYVKRNTETRSRNHCCSEKSVSITRFECVSADLVIRHAKRMRRITMSDVASPPLSHYSTLSHKRQAFRRKVIEYKMCVFRFSLQLLSETFHSKKWAKYDQKFILVPHGTYRLLFLDYNENLIFPGQFRKKIFKYNISRKSVQWELSCSMRTDG
jgi:hypothetical protein